MYLFEDFVLLVPSGYCRSILKRRQVPPQTQTGMTMSQTLKLSQYQSLPRYRIPLDLSRSSSKVSKYQDPLHLLQDYAAEVSSVAPNMTTSCLSCAYAPDFDMNL